MTEDARIEARLEIAMEVLRAARKLAVEAGDHRTDTDLQGAMSKVGAALSRHRGRVAA
jgi:uncharacterized protein YqgV (UPF0045/DUF77 family)